MLIVSLTTTSERLKLCTQTLISLVNQSFKPEKIIVWISSSAYLRDKGICADHQWVREVQAELPLVEVRWTDNTGPYRKVLPTLEMCRDEDLVVSADDDIVYGRDWLKKIMAAHLKYPGEIIVGRARQVKRNKLGRETTYLQWPIIREEQVLDRDFVVTFGGGALLPRAAFSFGDILNKDFLEVAPTSDDLWLSRIIESQSTSVRCVPEILEELFFIEHNEGLIKSNSPSLNTKFQIFLFWLIYKRLGNLGVSICQNDVAYKKTKKYFETYKSRKIVTSS